MRSFVRFTVITAFMAMITAAMVIVPVAAQLSQAADDVLILDKDSETSVTGIVTELDNDSFVLVSDDKKIDVDLDKIDLGDGAEHLLSNGMRVSVEGTFDKDELDATRVVKIQDGSEAEAEKAAEQAKDIKDF